jgi:NADH-quinone oxidoreductase subunit G
LWYKGEEVLRVTARKDKYGEVEDWICNSCRFDHKKTSDWVIDGASHIDHHSVISANHYETAKALENLKSDIEKHKKHLEGNKFALGHGAMNPNNQ